MGSKLIDKLDAEWAWLSRSRRGVRALGRWAENDAELRRFVDLADLVQFVHRRDRAADADRVLYRLACRALTDDLAARTMLACMMPGAKNLTCGYLWAHADADEAAAAVLMAMWERIRTYPCERRPGKVAANIQLDTRQRVSRMAARDAREQARRVVVADAAVDAAALRGPFACTDSRFTVGRPGRGSSGFCDGESATEFEPDAGCGR